MRDDFGPASDVDVRVAFAPGHMPGLAFFAMADELGAIAGRPLDLNTIESLSPYVRDAVLRGTHVLYAAARPTAPGAARAGPRPRGREAVAVPRGTTAAAVAADRGLTLALIRLLEVVGAAANRAAPQERARDGGIPGRPIIGPRNRLLYGNGAVDLRAAVRGGSARWSEGHPAPTKTKSIVRALLVLAHCGSSVQCIPECKSIG